MEGKKAAHVNKTQERWKIYTGFSAEKLICCWVTTKCVWLFQLMFNVFMCCDPTLPLLRGSVSCCTYTLFRWCKQWSDLYFFFFYSHIDNLQNRVSRVKTEETLTHTGQKMRNSLENDAWKCSLYKSDFEIIWIVSVYSLCLRKCTKAV